MEYGVESIVLKKRGGFAEPVVLFLIIISVEQQNKRSGSGLYSQGLWSVFDLIIGIDLINYRSSDCLAFSPDGQRLPRLFQMNLGIKYRQHRFSLYRLLFHSALRVEWS